MFHVSFTQAFVVGENVFGGNSGSSHPKGGSKGMKSIMKKNG